MFNLDKPDGTYWTDHVGSESDGNSGFWWDREGVRYVLLHGTWPFELKAMDIKANLNVWPRRLGKSSGHGGYIRYAELASEYLTKQSDIITKERPVVLVGHSLGGAVAQFLAFMLKEKGYNIVDVVTYASPTNWGKPKLVKQFRTLFPNAVNYAVGLDLTRWMWLLTLPLFYGSASKTVVLSSKGLNPIECHLPRKIVDLIPPPWDVTKP